MTGTPVLDLRTVDSLLLFEQIRPSPIFVFSPDYLSCILNDYWLMNLRDDCTRTLLELETVIAQLSGGEFTEPISILHRATIGQHTRHTLEFFVCFMEGYLTGSIDYDNRKHDKGIETDKKKALLKISEITGFLTKNLENIPLKLTVNYHDKNERDSIIITTNYLRELAYNLEHAIHHMAIIRIGLNHLRPDMDIPKGFGVAPSTLRHREEPPVERQINR